MSEPPISGRKGAGMNRKIRKLTDMITQAKKDVKELEERLAAAKLKLDRGDITNADFTKARMQLSERLKGKRAVIAKWEKARLNEEHRLREKKEDEEEESEKRDELRAERRRERKKEKRRRAKAGEDEGSEEGGGGEGGKGKKKSKGFLSFLFGR